MQLSRTRGVRIRGAGWAAITASWALFFCSSCGGRVEPSTDAPRPETTAASDTGGSTQGSDSGSDDTDSDQTLGECVEGWLPSEGDCPWFGSDQRCYATKLDACACVCPRDRNSTCISGLPGGPDSQTSVSCF